MAWTEAYVRTKWHLDPSSRLATKDMGRKLGAEPLWGSWVPIKCNVAGAEPYLHSKFHLDPSNRLAKVHQRYRQIEQNRTYIQTRQRSDSIGRTVFAARRFASAVLAIAIPSVCPSAVRLSVRHTPVLCQNEGTYHGAVCTFG